jgi:hypothetical protein
MWKCQRYALEGKTRAHVAIAMTYSAVYGSVDDHHLARLLIDRPPMVVDRWAWVEAAYQSWSAPIVLCLAWPRAAWEMSPVSPGRLSSSTPGDDLPRRIDDNAAIFTAARNSLQRCLQCGVLGRIEGPLGIFVIPPSPKVSQV